MATRAPTASSVKSYGRSICDPAGRRAGARWRPASRVFLLHATAERVARVLPANRPCGSCAPRLRARVWAPGIGNPLRMDTVAAIRLALSLAATYQDEGRPLDRVAQSDIEKEVIHLSDDDTARSARDVALQIAFRECRYSVADLALACQLFLDHKWPSWRWRAVAPSEASPMHHALFAACRCSLALSPDGLPELPRERRLRMIVQSSPSDCTTRPAFSVHLSTRSTK